MKKPTNAFVLNEEICTQAFIDLLIHDDSDIKPIFATDNYSAYDAYFKQTNSKGVVKHYFVEIKHRKAHYDSFILEHKKLEGMRKQALKDYNVTLEECEFIYVNFTPKLTVSWNITRVDKEIEQEVGMFNKATSRSIYDKKPKSVYYLPVTSGRVSNYKLDRPRMIERLGYAA